MGRSPCCEKEGLRRGRWTAEEDERLKNYILANGEGSWKSLPKNAGLLRCGKSCRLRWVNYLRSNLKRGKFSAQEDEIIINLHASMGNKWSIIAGLLPGRTDNEIKNYWNSHLGRRIDSYRKPNHVFVPPPAIAAAVKAAGKRTSASTGSSVKKTKHRRVDHSSSKPKPCRTGPIPTPTPTPILHEEENGNASTDMSLTPWEDPSPEPGICELGVLGMDSQTLSLDDLLADADGILPTREEEVKMEKDNREYADGDNAGSLSVNIGECWPDVGSPVKYSGGVGWDLDLALGWDLDCDWGNEEWGQEQNTSSPRLRVNSHDRDSDKYGEMVAWILSQ